jgi:hypothetical protein
LDKTQIHEHLHDLDTFNEFIQDSDIDIFHRIDPDAEISGPDWSGSCRNSDDRQVSANVGGDDGDNDDGHGGCSNGYNDEDGDNEDWAVWDENDHDLYMVQFRALSGCKPPRNGEMPVLHMNLCFFLVNYA